MDIWLARVVEKTTSYINSLTYFNLQKETLKPQLEALTKLKFLKNNIELVNDILCSLQ